MRDWMYRLAVLAAALAGGAVRADPTIGSYAQDVEAKEWLNTDEGQPVSLAECRGMITVLFCWVTWHPGGEYVMPMMAQIDNSGYGKRSGVFLIGITDADRTRVEEMIKKERVFFPIGLEAKKTFEDYKLTSFPRAIIIDPNGKVAYAGWPGEKGGDPLLKEIQKVASETPPTKTHPEETAKVQAYLKQARQALREERYQDAFRAATNAFDHALRGDELKSRCQDVLDLVEAIARDKLAQAQQAADEGSFENAVTTWLEVQREFRGMDVARAGRKRLEALQKKEPDVAELIRRQSSIGQAETILAAALELIQDRQFGRAYEKLEQIIEEYGGTETATKAQTVLDRMQASDGIMGYVRDHKASRACRNLLFQAEAYERDGRVKEARELYREVLDNYSDTTYAEQAAQRLARLP
jgi:cytochrome c biogenesis protein CcmG/thiol:disulfide interchange protein DsbE